MGFVYQTFSIFWPKANKKKGTKNKEVANNSKSNYRIEILLQSISIMPLLHWIPHHFSYNYTKSNKSSFPPSSHFSIFSTIESQKLKDLWLSPRKGLKYLIGQLHWQYKSPSQSIDFTLQGIDPHNWLVMPLKLLKGFEFIIKDSKKRDHISKL